jgi:hypothetical protein
MIPLSLAMFGFSVYRFVTSTNGDLFLPSMLLINLVNFSQMFLRIRLTMSPIGISVTIDRSMATVWSNVERIQLISLGYLIKRDVLCLVLREPIQGKRGRSLLGVPAELKGRVIPIHPAVWERMFTLEQELYGFLKANSVIGNQWSVPIDFAAISQRQTRFKWKLAAVLLAVLALPLIGLLLIRIF